MREVLRALQHRNFRLFFIGQGGSMIGTWMQQIAVSWLVYRLTGSALLLGITGFASNIAFLVVSPVAGVFTDRYDRRHLLIAAQSFSAVLATLLTVLTFLGEVTAWQAIAITLGIGIATALETPARQGFLLELVERRENLPNAIALNAMLFQMARFIGPALAGLVLAAFGEAWCFALNALSFVWIIAILLRLKTSGHKPGRNRPDWIEELRDGFRYAFGTMPLRRILLMLAVAGFMIAPYQTLMPLVATQTFGGDSRTYGFLIGAAGMGALCGSIYLAGRRGVPGLGRVIATGSLAAAIGLTLFALTGTYALGLAFMLLVGFGVITTAASTNTILQSVADEDKRGRVVGIYVMTFLGTQPLGNLVTGAMAQALGAQHALLLNGLLALCAALIFIAGFGSWRLAMRPLYARAGLTETAGTRFTSSS